MYLLVVFLVLLVGLPVALGAGLSLRDRRQRDGRLDGRQPVKPMQNRNDVEASRATMGLGRRAQGWQEWSRRR